VPRRTANTGYINKETANHPWTASPKGRRRSLVRSQDGRLLMQLEEAYSAEVTKLMEYDSKEDQQLRTVGTNQHSTSSTALQRAKKPQYRITGRNNRNRGQHNKEENRKMAREGAAWTTVM
jgi:hypothetical protein